MSDEGRYQPCGGCEGYVDTQRDSAWIRLYDRSKSLSTS